MRFSSLAIALAAATGLIGCANDRSSPTAPANAARDGAAAEQQRVVNVHDACDPASFNAAIGAGTCVRSGGMKFSEFIAQLTRHQRVEAWHFAPPELRVAVGTTLLAINRGGEVHTFTEVAHFGGGVSAQLNQLSGNPVPAPECLALDAEDFIAPGATYPVDEDDVGTELYQCCIHPWMRATVHIHG